MPRQNRVNPLNEIIVTPERGTFMGNRGVLHDAEGRIRRAWQGKRWIICLLEFRGRQRSVMKPGHYTELFFLDEATALAAGHRPCAECRRARFLDFCRGWGPPPRPTVSEIDDRLHVERLAPDGSRATYFAAEDDLPDGVFVLVQNQACLLWGGSLLPWSPGGYGKRWPHPTGETLQVLTPPSTVATIRAGYIPDVHPSA